MDGRNLARAFALGLAQQAYGMMPDEVEKLTFDCVYRKALDDPDPRRRVLCVAHRNAVSDRAVTIVLGLELRDEFLGIGCGGRSGCSG